MSLCEVPVQAEPAEKTLTEKAKALALNVGGFILGCYVLSCSVAVLFFEWQVAREHGFGVCLIFGSFIAGLKALVWPYFAFFA